MGAQRTQPPQHGQVVDPGPGLQPLAQPAGALEVLLGFDEGPYVGDLAHAQVAHAIGHQAVDGAGQVGVGLAERVGLGQQRQGAVGAVALQLEVCGLVDQVEDPGEGGVGHTGHRSSASAVCEATGQGASLG
jgi:hypothetical protein